MNFLEKLRIIWEGVSLVQRALLIAIILTFVIAGGLLTRWASRPDMRVLYSQLDPVEAAKITEKISEKNIAYKLLNGGTTIYVPKEQVAQLRLDMAKDDLPSGGQKGYGIFDNEKIGVPPFTQKINLNRALQDELAKSIQMIDGVTYARIHIVSPDQRLFSSDGEQTTASVVIKLRAGYRLNSVNIAAITHLVAGGVKGLMAENVTVIDSQGQLLSRDSEGIADNGASSVQDFRERVEKNLENKVEDMLTAVLGPGRSSVKVSAVVDMNSISLITEKYDPKGLTTKEEINENSKTDAETVLPSNEQTVAGGVEKESKTVSEMIYGKTVEKKIETPGKIQSLSVAAFVDLYPSDPNQTAPIMAVADVNEIIKKALGPKLEEGGLKVVNIKFNRPVDSLISDDEGGGLDLVAIAGQASMGIMAVCALIALKFFSGSKKKVSSSITGRQLSDGESAAGQLAPGSTEPEPVKIRRQIASALEDNPEQVKQLFVSWLEEKS